ncbi:N-acetyltransferase family protein [Actinoplanes sp. CA-252034]|uniref:GNAT family N-acetyltransferase n=1 Tax=Actinoplanes sp. CA-252034 TaxID=3239906 RepID=UPI003D975267
MLVRPATVGDLRAVAEIQQKIHPCTAQSVESRERAFLTVNERSRARYVVAEFDGRVAGYASAMLDHTTSEPGAAVLSVGVHPRHRRRGAGTALLADAEAHLRSVGAVTVRVWRPDEQGSAVFAERHGYRRRRSRRFSVTDPRQAPPAAAAPDGMCLVDLDEAGRDAVYTFDRVAPLDEPGDRPAGVTAAYTSSDATNTPMFVVNDRLGYQPAATEHPEVRQA